MKCPDCGNEIFEGQLFCDNCGRSLAAVWANAPDQTIGASQAIAEVEATPGPAPASAAEQPASIDTPPSPAASESATQTQAEPLASDPQQPTTPQLVVQGGSAVFPLETGRLILIGRTDPIEGIFPDVDLTPVDPTMGVSRRHAVIHEQGGQWFVQDLNSMNYTVVNRQRVLPQQEFLLQDGDEIRFARVVITFRSP
jgi:hypothetical protein